MEMFPDLKGIILKYNSTNLMTNNYHGVDKRDER